MRNLLLSIAALLLCPITLLAAEEAGDVSKVWTYPQVYQYSEQVTWYFDLAGTTFEEEDELYLWAWSPSEPDAGNWENSSDFAKLTYAGNFIWKIELCPTTYFNVTAEDIAASAGFWLRLKDKTGSKQSGVAQVPITTFDDFFTAGELIRSIPTKPAIDAPVSILFNSNLADGFEGATSVHMHSGLNNWDDNALQEYQAWLPEIVEKTKLKDLGNGFYKMDLIPNEYYPIDEDYVMEDITFFFVKDNWAATCAEQKLIAANVEAPKDPVFSFFPMKISKRDFLGISRLYNERGVISLQYTITAGSKVITGEISGTRDKISGFVDLVTELKDVEELTKINVEVRDNNDRVISNTDIPLVTLDENI